MDYLMGIDLGTSSVKTIIMDLDGNVAALGQENYDIQIPSAGYAEQDIELLWEAAAKTIKQAITNGRINSSDIKGIGFSGQMHGLVLLDKEMKPIRPMIIWADQRANRQINNIYNIIGRDEFRKITLNSLSPGFFLCSLMWVRDNEPQNYNKAYKAVLPKDYIRYKLCGELATDVTDASATLAFDGAKRCWAFDIIDKIGIDISLFPEHGEAYQIAGETIKECAEKTGLRCRIPVVYGGGDAIMQSVGNGIIKPGVISSNIGTAGQLTSAVASPVFDKQYRTNTFCHSKEDLWIIYGAHLNGGIVLKWLRNNYFPQFTFREFDKAASEIPAGSEGILFLPYLSGERTPYHDPFAKGILYGMTLNHNYKHMIRAAMEGVIFSLRLSLEIFKELNIPIEQVVASGGGAKSSVWIQMQADIFNKDIYTVSSDEAACTGAAIVAGVGVEIYKSIEQACFRIVKYNQAVTLPNLKNVKVYDEAFEKFKMLYQNNKTPQGRDGS